MLITQNKNTVYCLFKTVFILMVCVFQLNGQDIIFSQYYNAPLQLNPAFAGTNNGSHLNINYRLQWPGLVAGYTTYAASYDTAIKKLNSGFGFWVSNDNAGDGILKTIELKGIYSYKIRFNGDWQLKMALEAGVRQTALDWDRLIFYDQIDPFSGPFDAAGLPNISTEERPDNLTNGRMDVSSGFLLYSPKLYAGLTLRHVNSPYIGFSNDSTLDRYGLPMLFNLHAGYKITLLEGNKRQQGAFISPNILLAKQSDFYQFNIGTYLQVNALFGGIWMRNTTGNMDAIIFSFGLDTGNFKVSYSFDYTISKLGIGTGGSHEMGLSMDFGGGNESKLNDCLSLFR